MIPLCTPDIRGKEKEYTADAIDSGYLCDGPYLERFAAALCEWTGRDHCVLTSSGTAALHTAIVASRLGRGAIAVPDWTFVATANAVFLSGAEVSLEDSGEHGDLYPRINVDVLGRVNRKPSHHIRDSAQSIGNTRAFDTDLPQAVSFNANKLICASGGGALFLTDDEPIERAEDFISQARIPGVYDHKRPATNYRMSNLQAAVGLAQLETIGERIRRKLEIWQAYWEAGVPMFGDPSAFLAVMEHPKAMEIGERLRAQAIGAQSLWMPLHLTAAYAGTRRRINGDAERKWRTTLALPCSTWMTKGQAETVAARVAKVVGEFA